MASALHPPPLPNAPGMSIAGWSWEDYAQLADDGRRYELLEGDLFMVPSPQFDHQDLVGALYFHLRQAVGPAGTVILAPFDMRLDAVSAPQPDLMVVLAAHRGRIQRTHLDGPADLAVEILSPGGATRDLVRKRRMYAAAGVPEYWIVDPAARSILCLQHDGHGYPEAVALTGTQPVPSRIVPGAPRTVQGWLAG